jgi:hypothetical protein
MLSWWAAYSGGPAKSARGCQRDQTSGLAASAFTTLRRWVDCAGRRGCSSIELMPAALRARSGEAPRLGFCELCERGSAADDHAGVDGSRHQRRAARPRRARSRGDELARRRSSEASSRTGEVARRRRRPRRRRFFLRMTSGLRAAGPQTKNKLPLLALLAPTRALATVTSAVAARSPAKSSDQGVCATAVGLGLPTVGVGELRFDS